MSKDQEPAPIREVIERLMKIYSKKRSFNNAQVKLIWEKSVGKAVSNLTQNIYTKNNILFVRVESSSCRDYLFANKLAIIKRMNLSLSEPVKDIIFS